MALSREVVGGLSQAELVDLVVRQSELIAGLGARIRELEAERDRNDLTQRMPGLKPTATPGRRKSGPHQRRSHGFCRRRAEPTDQVKHGPEPVST